VSYVSRSHLLAEVSSGAITCSMAKDIASRLRWAPMLPRIMCLRTSPPDWSGLRCCHVSHSSLRATCFKHKEKPSRLACAVSHACFQRISACFQCDSRQGHHAPIRHADIQCSQYLQGVRTSIYSVTTVRLQYDASTMDHSPDTATVSSDSTARRHTVDLVQRGR
jgi:hypothetical protein